MLLTFQPFHNTSQKATRVRCFANRIYPFQSFVFISPYNRGHWPDRFLSSAEPVLTIVGPVSAVDAPVVGAVLVYGSGTRVEKAVLTALLGQGAVRAFVELWNAEITASVKVAGRLVTRSIS